MLKTKQGLLESNEGVFDETRYELELSIDESNDEFGVAGGGAFGRLLKPVCDESNELVKNLSFNDSVLLLNGVLGDFEDEEKGENIDLKNLSDKPFFGDGVINEKLFVVVSVKEIVVSFFVPKYGVSSSTGLTETLKIKKVSFTKIHCLLEHLILKE